MAYTDEIQLYKTKLDDILAKKYIDQSLLVGFTASLQAKFYGWIVADLDRYHHNLGLPFRTIDLFETLWADFHSPIIKFSSTSMPLCLKRLTTTSKSVSGKETGEF